MVADYRCGTLKISSGTPLASREGDRAYERDEGYRCAQHHRQQHARPAGLGPARQPGPHNSKLCR